MSPFYALIVYLTGSLSSPVPPAASQPKRPFIQSHSVGRVVASLSDELALRAFRVMVASDFNPRLGSYNGELDLLAAFVKHATTDTNRRLKYWIVCQDEETLDRSISLLAHMNMLSDRDGIYYLLNRPSLYLLDRFASMGDFQPSKLTLACGMIRYAFAFDPHAKLDILSEVEKHRALIAPYQPWLLKEGLARLKQFDDEAAIDLGGQIFTTMAASPASVDAFQRLLEEKGLDDSIREYALYGVYAVCGRFCNPAKEIQAALPAVIPYLASGNDEIRRRALSVLDVSDQFADKYESEIDAFMNKEPEGNVKFEAALLLLRIRPEHARSRNYLESLFDPGNKLKDFKWETLTWSRNKLPDCLAPILHKRLESGVNEQKEIIEVLGKLGFKARASVPLIRKLCESESKNVADAARKALKLLEYD